MRWLAGFAVVFVVVTGGCAQEWHPSLYLGNGDVWKQRIAVDVRNDGDQLVRGVPVSLKVGTEAGEAQLSGALAEAVRVCDADGTEMLFAINGADGQLVKRGPIAAGSVFTLPTECQAHAVARYYIYFDNPSAWLVPDFLDPTERKGPNAPNLTATASPPEALALTEAGTGAAWYAGLSPAPATDDPRSFRVPVPVVNVSSQAQPESLISIDLTALRARLGLPIDWGSTVTVDDQAQPVTSFRVGEALVFPASIPARTRRTFYLYFRAARQEPSAVVAATSAQQSYAAFLDTPHNLVRNPSFELGAQMPDEWLFNSGQRVFPGIRGLAEGAGLFGRRSARTDAPPDLGTRQPGWLQTIPVQGGRSYLFSGWIKCQGVEGSVSIGGRCLGTGSRPAGNRAEVALSPPISRDTDWTQVSKVMALPDECSQFEIRLTQQVAGTVWHDGLVLAEVQPTLIGAIQEQAGEENVRLTAWPVDAVIKVFQDARPPSEVPAARITCARNEKEPLQLAVRGPIAMPGVQIEVTAPQREGGAPLPDPKVGIVGFVPIDYPSNSYNMQASVWHRMFPSGITASDGFPGWWPDPILPRQRFDLAAGMTQPVWLTVNVPTEAAPGDYTGSVRFTRAGDVLAEVPFIVHVWDFALPAEGHLKAIAGRRGKDAVWEVPGQTTQQRYEALWKLMADYRLCPTIVEPEPEFTYEGGQVKVDFTAFDAAADYYFNTLKLPHAFTPFAFYGFGWGFPPGKRFGEEPYEGEFPYPGADRSQLRPEYKAAYQACLRTFLDHVKEKGWYDKFVLYMSDEPHYWNEPIREQLIALANMIHEVDPKLPIYSSTWDYRSEWDGSLSIWGLAHYGRVPENTIRQVEAGGAKVWWTTDGQICIDTPYCAVERLLPYYCFKYGAEAYEYYAIDVLLGDDPYQFGWHHFTPRSLRPGDQSFKRVHDGGGYLIYPGLPPDPPGPIPTIRLEQIRQGLEDYEYLYLLRERLAAHRTPEGAQALAAATNLVQIPSADGLESTQVLPRPEMVDQAKAAMGAAIEALGK